MSFVNTLPTERVAVLAALNPISQSASASATGYVDCSKFRRLLAVVQVGVLGSSATVDAKLTAGTTSSGGSTVDITPAITQLTQAGTDANKQVLINLDTAKLQTLTPGTNYRYVKLTVTVGTADSLTAALILGFDPINGPASDNNATTVDEVVTAS
jgi:hypothetical protein